MNIPLFSSLRSRLILLVFVVTIPLLILLIYSGLEHRNHASAHIQQEAMHIVVIAANKQQRLIKETRRLLSKLALVSQIKNGDSDSCNNFLAEELKEANIYANLGMINPNGDVFCSAIPMKGPVNASDRSFFQRTLKNHDFSIGDYQIGRITNVAVLVFSYPIFDDKKRLKAVLFAALPLSWINKLTEGSELPAGSVVNIIDHSTHTLLAQFPESSDKIGSSVEKSKLVDVMHTLGGTGTAKVTELDGSARFHAFSLLHDLPSGKEIYVSLGVPATGVHAKANELMLWNLSILIFVIALVLLFAWYGIHALVLRQVTELLGVTRRLASGHLDARVEVSDNKNEVSELGREFNRMAAELEKRDSDAIQAEYLLRNSEQELRHLVETVPDIIYTAAVTNSFAATFVSPALTRILGFTPEEFVSDPKQWAASIHDEDKERVLAHMHSALDNTKDEYNIEYRMWHKDGKTLRLLEDHARIYRDSAGHAVIIYGVMTDITERKQAESLSARIGRILEDSWNEIYVIDAATLRFIDVSNGACRNLGYSMDELKQLTPLDLMCDCTSEQLQALIAPLHQEEKPQVIFEVELQRKDSSCYPVEVRLQLSSSETPPVFIAIIQDISERKRYVVDMEYETTHDGLTNLPNRFILQDRLQHDLQVAHRETSQLVVLIINIIRLREINDIVGHDAGDLVLKEVANRLQNMLCESDTVSRLGGDEFVIVLPTVSNERTAVSASRVHKLFEEPIIIEDIRLEIEVAIGIALYPEHGDEPSMLLQCADIALGVSKKEATEFSIYNPENNPYSLRRLKLFGELRQAIHQKKLMLYYQPQIDIKSGRIISVEALARWLHPVEGMIPPNDFIPMIEMSGLIRPFTLWVIEEAIIQLKRWSEADIDLTIAVNLSTRNLLDSELPSSIEKLLKVHNVRPNHLTLEVTESALMSRPETALKVLTQLHEMGHRLSIDDFGTGYSSLAYLKKLPVCELKIDQAFVFGLTTNNEDATIVHSTINLAHNMGLKVVAEGVEDQDTLDMLEVLQCNIAQGYHMSRPLPVEELELWAISSPWGLQKDSI